MNHDLRFLKDQLVNAWEHMDIGEMHEHLDLKTSYESEPLGELISDWYSDNDRRNSILMSMEPNTDELDAWINEILHTVDNDRLIDNASELKYELEQMVLFCKGVDFPGMKAMVDSAQDVLDEI